MTLDEKKALVARFIGKCNEYADAELVRYRGQLDQAAGLDPPGFEPSGLEPSGFDPSGFGGSSAWRALAIQDKIVHWSAYRAFNEFTLKELAGDGLDHWFDDPDRQQ